MEKHVAKEIIAEARALAKDTPADTFVYCVILNILRACERRFNVKGEAAQALMRQVIDKALVRPVVE